MAEQETTSKAVAAVDRRPLGFFERMEHEMEDMRRQMFDVFPRSRFWRYRPTTPLQTEWAPAVDTYEKDGAFIVKAELPGVETDDVQVSLDNGVLTIGGTREEEKEVKEEHYHARERFAGSFSRSFALPEGVEASSVEASFQDGVLEVKVPLPAAAKLPAVTIPVKS